MSTGHSQVVFNAIGRVQALQGSSRVAFNATAFLGTTHTFTSGVPANAVPQPQATAITFPNGGTNVTVKVILGTSTTAPTDPTVGVAQRTWSKRSVAPGETLNLSFKSPPLAGPGAALLTTTQAEIGAPAPTIGASTLPFA